ncbi:MAG: PD-(D/E)XK nuclease family transposase [Bacilli bacterium]|nr:PD-(D/E)XK nuclease family transposase [Bacilli bacterium]
MKAANWPKPQRRKSIPVQDLCLLDNVIMNVALKNNPDAVKEILAPIFGRSDFVVENVSTQWHSQLIEGHSVYFDCFVTLGDGTIVDIEFQKTKAKMPLERIQHYYNILGAMALQEKRDYSKRNRAILVAIIEGDCFDQGSPLYVFGGYARDGSGMRFGEDEIYIVNAKLTNENTALGELMHDLRCKDPKDIRNPVLRKTLAMVKLDKEEHAMNEELLELNDELFQEGYLTGREEGEVSMVLRLYRGGVITREEAMNALNMGEAQFLSLLSQPSA